jgi:hypothetical protein
MNEGTRFRIFHLFWLTSNQLCQVRLVLDDILSFSETAARVRVSLVSILLHISDILGQDHQIKWVFGAEIFENQYHIPIIPYAIS